MREWGGSVLTFWLLVNLPEHALVPVFGFVHTLVLKERGGAESQRIWLKTTTLLM